MGTGQAVDLLGLVVWNPRCLRGGAGGGSGKVLQLDRVGATARCSCVGVPRRDFLGMHLCVVRSVKIVLGFSANVHLLLATTCVKGVFRVLPWSASACSLLFELRVG